MIVRVTAKNNNEDWISHLPSGICARIDCNLELCYPFRACQGRRRIQGTGVGMERRLAVIVAADVVGYSALMERDEAGTFERLKAGRKELFEPEIERHHRSRVRVMMSF